MPIIKCPRCQGYISSTAIECPHCKFGVATHIAINQLKSIAQSPIIVGIATIFVASFLISIISPTKKQPNTPAQNLAIIDGASSSAEYETLLAALRPKCQEPPNRIADMSVQTQEILSQKSYKTTNLEILKALLVIVHPAETEQECSVALAALATTLK